MSALHVWSSLDQLGFATARVLLAALWQSSILLVAIGALTWLLRKRRASVRHSLWVAGLLLGPMLPLVAALALRTGAPQAPVPVLPAYAEPIIVPALPAQPISALPEHPPAVSVPPQPETAPEAHVSVFAYPWALLLIVYGAGLAAFLAWLALGRIRIRRWIRSAVPLIDERALSAFRAARENVGLRRGFVVLKSNRAPAPVSFGIFHPMVLLPEGLADRLSDAELRALAIHELAHIKRKDPLVLFLVALVRAALFFHPLVWLAARQVSLLSEQAADDAVLDATGEAIPYAKMLARLAEDLPRRALSTEFAAGILFSKGAFLRRIQAILSDNRESIKKLSRLAFITTIAAILLSLGIALALPLGEKSTKTHAEGDAPVLTRSERKRAARLIAQLDTEIEAVWRPAADELIAMGPAVAPAVAALFKKAPADVPAIKILEAMAEDSYVQKVMLDGLQSTNPNVVHCSLIILGKSGNRKHTPRIASTMDRAPLGAIGALGQLGGDDAYQALVAALKAAPVEYRWLVSQHLAATGRREAIPHLIQALKRIDASYPQSSAKRIVRNIRKLQRENNIAIPPPLSGDTMIHSFPLRYIDAPNAQGSLEVFDLPTNSNHFIKLPKGLSSQYTMLLTAEKGTLAIRSSKGDTLVAYNGVRLAPVSLTITPPDRTWADAFLRMRQSDLAKHVRDYERLSNPTEIAPGMHAYPFKKGDLFVALLRDDRLVIIKVEDIQKRKHAQLALMYLDPLFNVVGSHTRALPPTTPAPTPSEAAKEPAQPLDEVRKLGQRIFAEVRAGRDREANLFLHMGVSAGLFDSYRRTLDLSAIALDAVYADQEAALITSNPLPAKTGPPQMVLIGLARKGSKWTGRFFEVGSSRHRDAKVEQFLDQHPQAHPILEFRLVDESPAKDAQPMENSQKKETLYVTRRALLTERDLKSASFRREVLPDGEETWRVVILLLPSASAKFAEITEQNLGRKLAIVFRGKLLSAPVIRSPISSGHAVIQVNAREEAERIAQALNKSLSYPFSRSTTKPTEKKAEKRTPQAIGAEATPRTACPIQRISAEEKENRASYRWRITRPKPVRVMHGWYSLVDGKIREHVGGGSHKTAGSDPLDLLFTYAIEGRTLILRMGYGQPTDALRAGRSETTIPSGAVLRTHHFAGYSEIAGPHQVLWRGDLVREGQIVKSVLYCAFTVLPDDPIEGFRPPMQHVDVSELKLKLKNLRDNEEAFVEALDKDASFSSIMKFHPQKEAIAAWTRLLQRNDLTDEMKVFAYWRIGSLYAYNHDPEAGERRDGPRADKALLKALEVDPHLISRETLNARTVFASGTISPKARASRYVGQYRFIRSIKDSWIDASVDRVRDYGLLIPASIYPWMNRRSRAQKRRYLQRRVEDTIETMEKGMLRLAKSDEDNWVATYLLGQIRDVARREFRDELKKLAHTGSKGKAPPPASFGPVIERVVNHTGKNCLIDFDRDKLFDGTLPENVIDQGREALYEWVAEQGIDAGGGMQPEIMGLIGFDIVAFPARNEYWNTKTPQSLLADKETAFNVSKPGSPVFLSSKGKVPVTWTFKTREGGMGILQIVGFTEKPKGVKIRYKMIRQSVKPAAPTRKPPEKPEE